MEKKRCAWAKGDLYQDYHDREWGVPLHDDQRLFEMLVLEGAQAGLAWITILRKRDAYRRAFENFRPEKVSRFTEKKLARLLADPGIVRNRLKIASAVNNAQCFLKVQKEFGSFDRYIWQFTDYQSVVNRFEDVRQLPARTEVSDAMSRDLKKRGFSFVGSTICYAYMQSIGMVNDHVRDCFRYAELIRAGKQVSLSAGEVETHQPKRRLP